MKKRTKPTKKEAPDVSRMYQSVVVTLSDGRVGIFGGKLLVNLADEGGPVKIRSIEFTEPSILPDDVHFEDMKA